MRSIGSSGDGAVPMSRLLRSSFFRQASWASLVWLLATLGLAADKAKKTEEPVKKEAKSDTFTFKVPVDVVVVNAIVTDKQGNPVKDLTVNEFKVYEDGKPQPIHTLALESYKATQTASSASPAGTAAAVTDEAGSAQPRMISLVVDDLATTGPDAFMYTQEALRKLLATGMNASDLVSLATASGAVNQPFTSDRDLLLAAVAELHTKVRRAGTLKSDCPELTDLQAERINNNDTDTFYLDVAVAEAIICGGNSDSSIVTQRVRMAAAQQFQENQYRYRNLLMSVRQYLRSLRHFEGRKSLILISDGFLPMYVRYELQEVTDMALRSGVILNTVDVRGLSTTNYQASDQLVVGTDPASAALLSRKPMFRIEDMRSQGDPLRQLASETGGLFIENTNDLAAGMRKILDSQSFYYILSYATPNPKPDGRYHKIKLEVTRPGLNITYRKGYYAPKEQLSFERRKKEDIIEALHAPGSLNEIPIRLSYNYFQVEDTRYQLALMTQVNVRGMKFVEEDSKHRNLITLVVIAFDEHDEYVDGVEKTIELNLSNPSYAALLDHGLTSKIDVKVPPGRYRIKAVVREGVDTKMGSLNKVIEVP
ncbi:MAG: VWA domain-containing protein [Acidimicrobiia bacterium]|nr:VWA domain-containing protein [Acidimicrobiia bacterium]